LSVVYSNAWAIEGGGYSDDTRILAVGRTAEERPNRISPAHNVPYMD